MGLRPLLKFSMTDAVREVRASSVDRVQEPPYSEHRFQASNSRTAESATGRLRSVTSGCLGGNLKAALTQQLTGA